MSIRRSAHKWWITCLLAGCAHQAEAPPVGTFGQSRQPVLGIVNRETTAAAARSDDRNAPRTPSPVERSALAKSSTEVSAADAVEAAPAAVDGAARARPAVDAEADIHNVKVELAASRQRERALRNAFAAADLPTREGLDLAGFLVQRERHMEALHVVDLALERCSGRGDLLALRLARAGLLRDVARWDLAILELRAVVRERGSESVSPATLMDLAEIEWVTGDNIAAKATLQTLQREHAGDDWLRLHQDELVAFHGRLDSARSEDDPLANGRLRDIFALLRAGSEVAGRIRLLQSLGDPAVGGGGRRVDDRERVAMRAIAIGCADESPAVRAHAVSLAGSNQVDDLPFWQTALRDPAPIVRKFAALSICRVERIEPTSALMGALSVEQDQAAFLAMHEALAKAMGVTPPASDPGTEQGREATVKHWKSLCDH